MAKKRGNQEGSIFKRSNGKWRAQISLDGNRLSFTGETKKECQDWIREIQGQINIGLTFESSQIKVDEFLKDWLGSMEPSIRYNTHKQYTQIVKNYLMPVLGKLKLIDLTPNIIQQMYNRMVKEGYGLRTIQLTHSILHRALVHAVKLGLLPRNPDDATSPPKPSPKEMKFWDEVQAQRFLLTAKQSDQQFYALFHLALVTGMRQGELLGLMWKDLNWETKLIKVQRQLIKKVGGGFELASPKTRAGTRLVELGDHSLSILKEHSLRQFSNIQRMGDSWQENDLMFPSEIGTFFDKANLRKRFKKLTKEAGLPDIRFHDLRHTAASLMLNNDTPLIIVSRRLGHSRPSITLDVYGHLIPGRQGEVANYMDQILIPIQVDFQEVEEKN